MLRKLDEVGRRKFRVQNHKHRFEWRDNEPSPKHEQGQSKGHKVESQDNFVSFNEVHPDDNVRLISAHFTPCDGQIVARYCFEDGLVALGTLGEEFYYYKNGRRVA